MIFFIGFPRSGTSLIHEGFSLHDKTAWPTNYSSKYPRYHFLNKMALEIFGEGKKDQFNELDFLNRFKVKPAEAYKFWNSLFNFENEFSRTYLKGFEATNNTKIEANREINKLLKSQGKELFTAKITGPGRILFLKSIFPKAKFVHIIRDGRYASNSLTKLPVWTEQDRFEKPWWSDPYIDKYRKYWNQELTNYEKSLLLWAEVTENIDYELSNLKETDFITIKYEDYLKDSIQEFSKILSFANLMFDENTKEYFDSYFTVKEKNRILPELNIESKINSIIENKLTEKGYSV